MIKFLKIRVVVVMVCLLSGVDGIAQNFSQHNWYFGSGARGIRFSRTNNSPSLVNNKSTPFGTGGSGVATDQSSGNLLFYTDGTNLYNAAHAVISNGLNANTNGNQPVAIGKNPVLTNQYFVFTNTASGVTGGTIFVTTVDMSLFGSEAFPSPALGNIAGAPNAATGLTNRSEAMITVPHANGTDFWLISHENGTDNYTSTLVSGGPSFTHNDFTNVTGLSMSAANFSYHEATGKIAVSPQTADRNVVILDFDNATGQLTFDQFVLNSAVSSTTTQSIYDTEWNNSGRFLYISRHGEAGIPADVLQFDMNNPGTSLASVLSLAPNRSYGLQMAPDSAIYHLYQATAGGPFLLGRLTNTDSTAVDVIHTADAFGGGLNFNGTQFPGFIARANVNLTVSFTSDGTCSNSPISFYPVVSPGADSLVWDFGDLATSNQWSPIHTYQSGGTFNVSVTAFLNGQTAVGNGTVVLTQFDLQLNLVSDTTACECEFPVNNGIPPCPNDVSDDFSVDVEVTGGTPTSVDWSNGDTGITLTPDSAGYYYVVATDASGCTAYTGINIREYDATDQRANIWYFGQNAGIDFNQQPPVSISGPVNTPEGVSVISDRNGQVIFSTDGVHVYDRDDVEIPTPPNGVGGEQGSTQSVIIVPVPGDETLYYIFTTQEVDQRHFEVRYSLFDLKMNGGDGGLVEYNQPLFSPSTERLTGNGNWLIAHEFGNNYFRAYPITPTGIGAPVISDIGSDHGFTPATEGQGYMKLGPNNILAVAYPSTNSNTIEVFDFADSTGAVLNYRSVDTKQNSGQVYGIEFSGDKMFATVRGATSALVEFFFDSLGRPFIIEPSIVNHPDELGAIQLGPDGQMYVAVNNRAYLATIQVNSDTTQVSAITEQGFPLTTGQSRLGLPNFIQNVGAAPQLAGMIVAGLCLGDSTTFTGIGTDPIDEFEWAFGDGFGATTQIAQHEYAAAGNYIVTLRVTNRCGLDTLITQQITIVAPPDDPNFLPPGGQPMLCNGPLTLEAEPAPGTAGYTYLWSTGETTRTIVVTRQSSVSVTITNPEGCTSSGSMNVIDNRPIVNLGPDQTICQNTAVAPLNSANPLADHAWFIDDTGNGNITNSQDVNTAATGLTEYKVTVSDPFTGCSVSDSVIFTINASPVFTAPATNTSSCVVNDGFITLTIVSPASLFTYSMGGPSTAQGIDQPPGAVADPDLTGLEAGAYTITVTDQVSSCATTSISTVNDNAFTITSVTRQTTCDPLVLRVVHTAAGAFTYRVLDAASGTVVATGGGTGSPFDITPGVPSGEYVIEMTSGGCSFSSPPARFDQDPRVPITGFAINGCTDPISIGVTGGTGWTWTGPNITSSNTLQTITATPSQGNQVYNVTVTAAGFCPRDSSVTVFVNNATTVDFNVPDLCANQVTLTAQPVPAGSYTYRWYRNGAFVPGGQSILVNAANDGDYRVEAVNSVSGCVFSSGIKPVNVLGDLILTMTTTLPCSGTPFTLTGSSNIPGTAFQWGVDGDDINGATQATLNRSTGGLYRLTGTLPGCTDFIEQQIILLPATPGSLPARALICNRPDNPQCVVDPASCLLILDAGANFTSYEWFQGGAPLPNTTQFLTVSEPAAYSVNLINSYGCPSSDETEVIEECTPIIEAPTAFRPGSPIVENSTFYLFTYFVADEGFQLFIYNRWGEMVFQSNKLDPELHKWNGGYNNNPDKLLPAGTYTYVVRYKSEFRDKGAAQEKRGGVVLLR